MQESVDEQLPGLGGGVVTTGVLSTLLKGDRQRLLSRLLFVVLAFAARGAGIKLARHGVKHRSKASVSAVPLRTLRPER